MKPSYGSPLFMLVATVAWAQAIPCGFAADTATADFSKLPSDENRERAKKALPPIAS